MISAALSSGIFYQQDKLERSKLNEVRPKKKINWSITLLNKKDNIDINWAILRKGDGD
jgi:hypothetical protein